MFCQVPTEEAHLEEDEENYNQQFHQPAIHQGERDPGLPVCPV